MSKATTAPSGLRLGLDHALLAQAQARLRQLPPRGLRLLLVTSATMKFQEKTVLSLFSHLPVTACDCLVAAAAERSLRPRLPGLRYVNEGQARAGRYDRVVAFDANASGLELGAAHACPVSFAGRLRQAHTQTSEAALARLPGPVQVYTTYASLPDAQQLEAFFGPGNWVLRGGIDFPPNVDLFHTATAPPRFAYLLAGGPDRDYDLILRERHLFTGRIAVSNAEPRPGEPQPGLARLRACEQFELLPWLPGEQYLRVLLHSRVVLLPVRGEMGGDYTSIADAAWYGRPVLTNRVTANAHMADRVVFFEGAAELAERVRELAQPRHYEEVSQRVQEAARRKNDLLGLLIGLYQDL